MYRITIKKEGKFSYWRAQAQYLNLSEGAKTRLEWMIFYESVAKRNALTTAKYFGIAPKTFHKWKGRFKLENLTTLEEHSKCPEHKRTWTVTEEEEQRVISLRLESKCKWGKKKLKVVYQKRFKSSISTSKVQKIINANNLYPDPVAKKKQVKKLKRKNLKPRTRIHEFKLHYPDTIVWHIDSIQIDWYGKRVYIFTALEDKTKLAFARAYEKASSKQATDFLKRLMYLTSDQMTVVHSDNGSEFAGEFEKAVHMLSITQIYSRVRTPTDNPALERFNGIIQDEWLSVSEVGLDDVTQGNLDLTEWLITYNFIRPHQTLDYQTPIDYAQIHYPEVLPMYPANTKTCKSMVRYKSLL